MTNGSGGFHATSGDHKLRPLPGSEVRTPGSERPEDPAFRAFESLFRAEYSAKCVEIIGDVASAPRVPCHVGSHSAAVGWIETYFSMDRGSFVSVLLAAEPKSAVRLAGLVKTFGDDHARRLRLCRVHRLPWVDEATMLDNAVMLPISSAWEAGVVSDKWYEEFRRGWNIALRAGRLEREKAERAKENREVRAKALLARTKG